MGTLPLTNACVTVASGQILAIVAILTDDEKRVMRSIARTAKSKTNVFSEGLLGRKKACRGIHLSAVLASLANEGLIRPVKRGVWQTTSIGRQVAHYLELRWFQERFGYQVIRR